MASTATEQQKEIFKQRFDFLPDEAKTKFKKMWDESDEEKKLQVFNRFTKAGGSLSPEKEAEASVYGSIEPTKEPPTNTESLSSIPGSSSAGTQLGTQIIDLIRQTQKPTTLNNLTRLALSYSKGVLEGTPGINPTVALDANQLQELEKQNLTEKALGVTGFATTSSPLFFSMTSRIPQAIPVIAKTMEANPRLGSMFMTALENMLFESTKPGATPRSVTSSGVISGTFGAVLPGKTGVERIVQKERAKEAKIAMKNIFEVADKEGDDFVSAFLEATTGVDNIAYQTTKRTGVNKVLSPENSATDAFFRKGKEVARSFEQRAYRVGKEYEMAEDMFFKENRNIKINTSDTLKTLNGFMKELGIVDGRGNKLPKATQTLEGSSKLFSLRDYINEVSGGGDVSFNRAIQIRRRVDSMAKTAYAKLERGKTLSPVEAAIVRMRGVTQRDIYNQAEAIAKKPPLSKKGILFSESELMEKSGEVLLDLKSRIKMASQKMTNALDNYKEKNSEYETMMQIESSVNGKLDGEDLGKMFSQYMRKGNAGLRERLNALEDFVSKNNPNYKFITTDNGIVNIDAANQILNTPQSLFRIKMIGGVAGFFLGLPASPLSGLATAYTGYQLTNPRRLLGGIEKTRNAILSAGNTSRAVQSVIPRQASSVSSAIINQNIQLEDE